MEIIRIKCKNWKNFTFFDLPIGNRIFVVGANASGKSNFLDVFRFIRDLVKQGGGLQYAVVQRGGVSKIRCLSARRDTDVSLEFYLKDDSAQQGPVWKYYLSFKHVGGGIMKSQAEIINEQVLCNDTLLLDRKASDSGEDNETKKFTHLEQVTANKEFRDMYNFFQKVSYLNIIPQLVREADSYILTAKKEDYFGRNLLERISILPENTRNSYIKSIREILKIAVPQLEDFQFIKDSTGKPHFSARCKHWRAKAGWQQEDQFSDGTLRIIGFLWALLDGTGPLLLEEPELYLHTAIIRQLAEFISFLQNKKDKIRQVFLTSHSYDLLDNKSIGLEEVYLISTKGEASEIKRASDIPEITREVEAGISLAEASTALTRPEQIDYLFSRI